MELMREGSFVVVTPIHRWHAADRTLLSDQPLYFFTFFCALVFFAFGQINKI